MQRKKRRSKIFDMKKRLPKDDICQSIFNSANDIIVFVNKHGTLVEVNDRVRDMLGYKREEIKGKLFSELPVFFPEDLPAITRDFKAAAKKKRLLVKRGANVHMMELRLRHKNGNPVIVEASTRILKTPVKGCCLLSIIRDISQRKKAEQALNEAHERFQKFMDSATEGFVLTDTNLNVLDVNAYVLEEFNVKREKVIGANVLDFSAGAYESGIYNKFMEVIETGRPLAYETLTPPNLGNKYLAIKVFKVGEGLGMTVRDVSTRKRSEIALIESEERFRTLYESAHAGLMVIDCDGEITHINNVACDILEVTKSEIQGEKSVSFFSKAVDDKLEPVAPENNPLINLGIAPIRNKVIGIHLDNPPKMLWLLLNIEPIIDRISRKLDELIVTFVKLTGRKGKTNHK